MTLTWNNSALIAFCEGQGIEYIDEGLLLITDTVTDMATRGKVSVKGAKIMAAMFDAAGANGDGVNLITNADAIKELVKVFIDAMPRAKKAAEGATTEKKKEYPLPSETLSVLDAPTSVIT